MASLYMAKYSRISSYLTLHLLPSEFPYIKDFSHNIFETVYHYFNSVVDPDPK